MSRESKFLSLILRHRPEEVGITLDSDGWVRIELLLRGLRKAGRRCWTNQLVTAVPLSPDT
ncbi:RNA 2'-phosphotransferase, partial [Yangia mangrovi]